MYIGFANNPASGVPNFASFTPDGKTLWSNWERVVLDKSKFYTNIRSSPLLLEDSLVFAQPYDEGLNWVDRKTGDLQQSLKLGEPISPHWCSPVAAKALLYIAKQDGGLYAVEYDTPRVFWKLYLGDHQNAGQRSIPVAAQNDASRKPIYATPAIAKDGTLVIGTGEGWLYCIREKR